MALVRPSEILDQPNAYLSPVLANPMAPQDFQSRMPTLADVRDEAKCAIELLKGPPPTNFQIPGQGVMHPAVMYHYLVPKLCLFAFLCKETDVPEDLQPFCLWALEQRLIAVTEASDAQLWGLIGQKDGTVSMYAKSFMENQSRIKIMNHLMSAHINRPEDALSHMEFSFKSLTKERGLSTEDVFPRNPEIYALYGEMLSRTKSRDTQAKAVMERIVRDIGQVKDKDNANGKIISVQAKLYLSRILRRMGEVDEAEKHETYLIKWFKKNPKLIPDYMLRRWFETEGPKDPVFQGLGGTKWLTEKRNVPSYKASERMSRVCKRCGKGEGLSFKLMKCSKCLHVYYCSRKCQVEDYPSHKSNCAEHAADLQKAESLKSTSPEDSKCVHDWTLYKNSTFSRDATCHALGLRFNAERGKTHILIMRVEYVPSSSGKKHVDVLDRFRVVEAGVFRLSDTGVLKDIDRFMGYPKGKSKELMDRTVEWERKVRDEKGKEKERASFFTLYISDDKRIVSFLKIGSASVEDLKNVKYDPNWRRLMNRDRGDVKPLRLPCGARDVERDYS